MKDNFALLKRPRFPVKQMLTIGLLPTSIRLAYYRIRGATIGPNVSMGFGSIINADEIEIGEGVTIGFGTFLRAKKVIIGRYARIGSASFFDAETISIGEDAKVSEQVFVGGLSSPTSHFQLGSRTILMQHTFINVARPVTIGDDTGIGGKCTIFTHGSWQNQLDGYPVNFAPVNIGSNVWIPWEVFIMPGVDIGDGATIGAGSLVTKSIPAGALAIGSPAKVVRTSEEYPMSPDHLERREMLAQMIIEFCEYFEHAGLKIDRSVQSDKEEIIVIDLKDKTYSLLVNYDGLINSSEIRDNNTALSLTEIDAGARQTMMNQNVLWLDLHRKERGGKSNPLGEEVVEFLKRFGIRFARAD
jgi:acetyltransferase-like isoleucine patch superfamily enzyme